MSPERGADPGSPGGGAAMGEGGAGPEAGGPAAYRLVLEYDGAGFAGWQSQRADRRTVQGVLEAAFRKLAPGPVHVLGAGRTDAGVHALGQVAGVRCRVRMDPPELQRALNALLPEDVAVRAATRAAPDFHAIRDARRKHYRYQVWNGPVRSPLRRARFHWVRAALDADAMRRAAASLEGVRDFACFETRASEQERPGRSTVRRLDRVAVEGRPGDEIRLEVEGDGFLRHMVRAMAGTLIEVGLGRRRADALPSMLASRDRRQAGPTAPARGLVLVAVEAGAPSAGASSAPSTRDPGAFGHRNA